MSPRSVLITGGNRGIGLGLVKQYLEKPQTEFVFATCRDPSRAYDLQQLVLRHPGKLFILQLTLTDHESFKGLVEKVERIVGDRGLNLLINNAAHPGDDWGQEPDAELMKEAFAINCIAPYFFSRAFWPLMKKAAENNPEKSFGVNRSAIIMMSSSVGSIAGNQTAELLAYRCSKTSLNMAMKNLSIEVQNDDILVMSMHPGWVQTEMGGTNAKISVENCCLTMINTLNGLTREDHGGFKRYNNKPLAW